MGRGGTLCYMAVMVDLLVCLHCGRPITEHVALLDLTPAEVKAALAYKAEFEGLEPHEVLGVYCRGVRAILR